MAEIQLGDKVRDIVTGFTGTVVNKTEFLNGCVQYGVIPKCGKDNKAPEEVGIDEQNLEVIKPKKKKKVKKKESNGGPYKMAQKMRGF